VDDVWVEPCPVCGGEVPIPDDVLVNGVVTCPHCGRGLIVQVRIVPKDV
jgi:DNA-directed RNA polymerase subunit RPC12/RpoP